MTKRLIILLSILVLMTIYFLCNDNSEKSETIFAKKFISNQLEESFLIDSINIPKLEIESNDKQIESTSIRLSTSFLDLKKEEEMIKKSIEEYEYIVENNLLNDTGDEVVPVDVTDENENRVYDEEDDFIDADSKELDVSIHAYGEK